MIEKLLLEKFRQILGNQYELFDSDFFNRNFTTVIPAYGQYSIQINYDTFNKYKDKIVGVIQVQQAQYGVTSYESLNTTYSLSLWIPINYQFISNNGENIKPSKFNIDQDLIKLRNELNNKTIMFSNGLKGELSFSNPSGVSSIENTGSYKRKIITITGKINLTSNGYYGRDYKIEIGKLNTNETYDYFIIKDINSINFTPQPNTVENHEQGDLIPEENVEAVKQACVFTVNDASIYDFNEEFTKLALSGKQSKNMYMLRISKKISDESEFIEIVNYPVYLTVSLTYQYGDSDIGVFSVSCVRCKE